ncbi:hypothetical protein HNQ88_001027 [Aureibacter tunicatorum]|uniref:Uncharacterized protein n=1 Tax=Aureibacter tunicatorum TaxID=866807 RepID=A0AAE3XLM8_9BACT|nr:hypothetical protein [Aureibacter tunicatorum]BDD03084.1 hypothetical protein AUTU_05670 [Aureibacter tunicatorum]
MLCGEIMVCFFVKLIKWIKIHYNVNTYCFISYRFGDSYTWR